MDESKIKEVHELLRRIEELTRNKERLVKLHDKAAVFTYFGGTRVGQLSFRGVDRYDSPASEIIVPITSEILEALVKEIDFMREGMMHICRQLGVVFKEDGL